MLYCLLYRQDGRTGHRSMTKRLHELMHDHTSTLCQRCDRPCFFTTQHNVSSCNAQYCIIDFVGHCLRDNDKNNVNFTCPACLENEGFNIDQLKIIAIKHSSFNIDSDMSFDNLVNNYNTRTSSLLQLPNINIKQEFSSPTQSIASLSDGDNSTINRITVNHNSYDSCASQSGSGSGSGHNNNITNNNSSTATNQQQHDPNIVIDNSGALVAIPKARGKRGFSCHQCKTSKDVKQLMICKSHILHPQSKRVCHKKYCLTCLQWCYMMNDFEAMTQEFKNKWLCPSCYGVCTCAACKRKNNNNNTSTTTQQQQQSEHSSSKHSNDNSTTVQQRPIKRANTNANTNNDITSSATQQAINNNNSLLPSIHNNMIFDQAQRSILETLAQQHPNLFNTYTGNNTSSAIQQQSQPQIPPISNNLSFNQTPYTQQPVYYSNSTYANMSQIDNNNQSSNNNSDNAYLNDMIYNNNNAGLPFDIDYSGADPETIQQLTSLCEQLLQAQNAGVDLQALKNQLAQMPSSTATTSQQQQQSLQQQKSLPQCSTNNIVLGNNLQQAVHAFNNLSANNLVTNDNISTNNDSQHLTSLQVENLVKQYGHTVHTVNTQTSYTPPTTLQHVVYSNTSNNVNSNSNNIQPPDVHAYFGLDYCTALREKQRKQNKIQSTTQQHIQHL